MPDPAVNTPETLRVREATLVRSIAGGDDGALGDAFDRYGSLVYGVALRVLGAASDAEEVLQDVFVQLWRRAAQFDAERGSLAGFLATLARNAAIDRLRSRRSRRAEGSEPLDLLSFPTVPPLEFASLDEARAQIVRALGSLPDVEREVLELAYFGGLSQSEIAERTGAPLGTVKGRARNGLRRLRESLPPGLGGAS